MDRLDLMSCQYLNQLQHPLARQQTDLWSLMQVVSRPLPSLCHQQHLTRPQIVTFLLRDPVARPTLTTLAVSFPIEQNLFNHCSFLTSLTGKWYQVTGTGHQMTASLCDYADFDTMLSVWTGDCSDLVCVGGNDYGCSWYYSASTVTWYSSAGQTYYIFVCKCPCTPAS